VNRPPKGDEYRRGNFAGMMFQPSANDTPDMTIRIKQGSFWINNEKFIEYAGGVSPKIEVPSSGAKWVLVALNKTGKCVIVNGLPRANNPEPPTLSQNMLPLAFVYVKSSTTVITNDMVYDARPEFVVGGYPIHHNDLQNRNKDNAHSIEAITGLREELDEKITSEDAKNLIRNKADYNGTVSSSFTLNADDSGVPVEHCGIYVNRGALPKVGIKYNEDLDEWQYSNDGTNWLSWNDGVNTPNASATEFGVVKLSADPSDEPIAVGINDPRYLSIDEKVTKNDLRNIYITREEVLNRLEDKMDVEGTYSKDDINNIFVTKSSLSNSMLDTYTRGQIDSFLQVKANAAQVYTKADVDNALQNYYTKAETDDLFNSLDLSALKDFNINNYYVKSETDSLLQSVVTNTYTRNVLDAKLDTKANAVDVHTELDNKANVSDVYTKDYIDNQFVQLDNNHKNLFYEKSAVDVLLNERALSNHNHSSGDIIEDDAHNFVSKNQINSWNSKQDALGFVPEDSSKKGLANGYAPLDNNGQIPIEYIPDEAKNETSIEVIDTYDDLLVIPDMKLKDGNHYVVLDATGDPSGITGRAEYVYHNNEFVCTSHNQLQSVDWNNITNKPENLGTEVDLSNYYTKNEIDSSISNLVSNIDGKANVSSVYTKEEVDNLIPSQIDAYTKTEVDSLLNDKVSVGSVYSKDEVDGLVNNVSIDAYTKSEADTLLNSKANLNDVYSKSEIDSLVSSRTKELQEFTSGDCIFVAYENDAITFTKTNNSISIVKNKEVKSVRFSVSTDEIGSNNRILIDYDANSTNNNMLTYDYANIQYMQLMGTKAATKIGTNIYYTNENNPHYCECALPFDNQGPVVVKITY